MFGGCVTRLENGQGWLKGGQIIEFVLWISLHPLAVLPGRLPEWRHKASMMECPPLLHAPLTAGVRDGHTLTPGFVKHIAFHYLGIYVAGADWSQIGNITKYSSTLNIQTMWETYN